MILPGNDPNMWRIYHDKCKRDENVRESGRRLEGLEGAPERERRLASSDDEDEEAEPELDPALERTKNREELYMSKIIPLQFDYRGKF
jgi:hypothetical protein